VQYFYQNQKDGTNQNYRTTIHTRPLSNQQNQRPIHKPLNKKRRNAIAAFFVIEDYLKISLSLLQNQQ
jgi:hypothetical protein